MKLTRADAIIAQQLDELLSKSTPFALSSRAPGAPTFLPFVKGLILSTNLIELINDHLQNGLRAGWGQVIDLKDGNLLSRECDVIIYHGKAYWKSQNSSMHYVLIERTKSAAIIQVKSTIDSVSEEDRSYCKDTRKFSPRIWYLAENCIANSDRRANQIGQDLRQCGYKHFFYLKRLNKEFEEEIAYNSFAAFIRLIGSLR